MEGFSTPFMKSHHTHVISDISQSNHLHHNLGYHDISHQKLFDFYLPILTTLRNLNLFTILLISLYLKNANQMNKQQMVKGGSLKYT
jgi:hypothetical protein